MREFKPNVYENFDAETGKKIEETASKKEGETNFSVESDHLYDSFKLDDESNK